MKNVILLEIIADQITEKIIDSFLESQSEENYRIAHKAPGPESGAPLYDLSSVYPEDIYSNLGAQYYGHYGGNHPEDQFTISLIKSYKGKPDKPIKIYRAVPKTLDKSQLKINSGDWVSINKNYAVEHGIAHLNGKYKILSKIVPASSLFTNGDSIQEWGYYP